MLFPPGLEGVFLSLSLTVSWDSDGTNPNPTTLPASKRRVQWSLPSGALLHARAIRKIPTRWRVGIIVAIFVLLDLIVLGVIIAAVNKGFT